MFANSGDRAKAIEHYTVALKLMPSPLTYAKRAECYLKLKKPNAAVRDCDKALDANPDSAKALRIRGSAHRFLGSYEAAQADLAAAQRIDYDDSIDEIQKFVNKRCVDRRAKKVAKEKKQRDRMQQEAKERKERLIERANIMMARLTEENSKLAKKQAAYQRNARDRDAVAEEEFERFCSEAMFRVQILEQRLAAHEETALKKYQELDERLSGDPRLNVLTNP